MNQHWCTKQMKGIAALTAAMLSLLAVGVHAVQAEEEEEEIFTSGDYTYTLMVSVDDENVKAACIESYTGSETNLVIPETLDDLPVVALGDTAFVDNDTLETVTLPSQMVGIGNTTFADCSNLKSYQVAENSLYFQSIDGVLYASEGKYLVRYPIGTNPVNVTIPDGVYDIGYVAFAYCDTLQSVTFPDSLKTIGAWAFADCEQLNNVTLPDAVTEIEEYTFYGCAALDALTLPDTIKTIGAAAFAGTSLGEFEVPKECTTIGQAAFAGTPMTEVTIPATVTFIDYSAFGYQLDAEQNLTINADFVIYGEKGSDAERYASDAENGNTFTFREIEDKHENLEEVPIGQESSVDSSANVEEDGLSAVSLIGGIVCGVVCLALVVWLIVLIARKASKRGDTES